ncbi:MFS transporter [Saccharospirillum mangrovi]|uniref:MFS transporter n=1 Tax=Saccharospirillum mangrovi TaxID=2161747 RepID=UPI000D37C1EF|nr:MFS transporter [Saccharospirillum mangrovi]
MLPITQEYVGEKLKNLIAISVFRALSEKTTYFILPLWAYELTSSSGLMSSVRLFEFLPFLLIGLVIGTIVDRIGSRSGFIIGTSGQAIAIFLLAVTGAVDQRLMVGLVFTSMGFTYFAANSFMVQVKFELPSDRIVNFTKINSMVSNSIDSTGPAIIGLLLIFISYKSALILSVLLLCLTLTLGSISFRVNPGDSSSPFLKDFAKGFKVAYSLKTLWTLSWWTAVTNSIIVLTEIAIIFYCKKTLGLSDAAIGVLLGISGLGAILGSYFSESLEKLFGVIKILIFSIILIGAAYIICSINLNVFTIAMLLFAESFLYSMYVVCIRTYRLLITPKSDIGKVSGISGSIFKSLMPISLGLYALLGSHISVDRLLSWLGTFLIIGALILLSSKILNLNQKLSQNY